MKLKKDSHNSLTITSIYLIFKQMTTRSEKNSYLKVIQHVPIRLLVLNLNYHLNYDLLIIELLFLVTN